MAPIYAIMIIALMFFGIKFYVDKKKKSIEIDVGEGLCAECGSRVENQKCPKCDNL